MKDVRYDGTADVARITRDDGDVYEWEGNGAVVAVTNDEADEITKDPRFSIAEDGDDEDEEFFDEDAPDDD